MITQSLVSPRHRQGQDKRPASARFSLQFSEISIEEKFNFAI